MQFNQTVVESQAEYGAGSRTITRVDAIDEQAASLRRHRCLHVERESVSPPSFHLEPRKDRLARSLENGSPSQVLYVH